MPVRIAINGFGRIGRSSFKIAFDNPKAEIVAINDLTNPRVLAHLLKYDTAYGIFDKEIYMEEDGKIVQLSDYHGETDFYTTTAKETYLVVGGKKTLVTSIPDPTQLPWKDLNVDIVLECTGRYVEGDAALDHLKAGAKKVVVSAPTKGGTIPTFVLGANQDQYLGQNAFSNASCTTNCTSPVVSIIHSKFKVLKAMLTTVHALTSGQNLVDGPHKDPRRARAAAENIVPTKTGAAKAIGEVVPELSGKLDGLAVRVPSMVVSLTDLVCTLKKEVTAEEINKLFKDKADKDNFVVMAEDDLGVIFLVKREEE